MARLLVVCTVLLCALSKITVYSPSSFKEEVVSRYEGGELPASLANFGNPPYGSTMIGRVYMPKLKDEKKACEPLHPINFKEDDPLGNEALSSPILLVNRGDCPFVRKVRHAQDIGAKAVLVVDDNEEDESKIKKIVITDDGSAGDINIPSFLISKQAGALIRETEKKEEVVLVLTFELGNQTAALDVTLWLTSGHNATLMFISDFRDSALAFPTESIQFRPRYVLWYCASCKNDDYQKASENCLSGGRYCSPDPDGNGPLNGRAVVSEDLRQICLFKETRQKGMGPWFKYVSAVYSNCLNLGLKEDCSYRVMSDFANVKKVKECVNDSFTGSDHTIDDNKILKAEKKMWLSEGPGFFPALQINNVTYKGDFETQEVMLALCSSFTTAPDNCIGVLPQKSVEMVSFVNLVLTILFVLGILTGVLVIYRLWMRREMRRDLKDQVTSAISEYVSLNSEGRRAFT